MANNDARQDLDRQKMRDIGRVLGFFSAYSELQTGMATYHTEYDASCLCDPKEGLKKSQRRKKESRRIIKMV